MALSDRVRLAVNLKIAREAAGISQTDAGKAVKKSRGTIVNWENPDNPAEPDSDEVATLARLYGLSSQDLRFGNLVKPSTAIVAAPEREEGGRAFVARTKKATPKSGRGRSA